MNPSLSRTSSLASLISEDGSIASSGSSEVKRTRKRFTSVQLVMLEQLFHETSHPTREQREKLSQMADLELRSVTVWFQNKRQTERRVALTNATNTQSSRSASTSRSHNATLTSHTRPSLDHVASRTEHRVQPKTPPRKVAPSSSGALWEAMQSSPIAPPADSPEATRVFVEFGKRKLRRTRTLEWACAAARLADKEGKRIEEECIDQQENVGMIVDDGGDTEEDEEHEAVTPYNSFSGDVPMLGSIAARGKTHDEETMNAALVLCGLRQ